MRHSSRRVIVLRARLVRFFVAHCLLVFRPRFVRASKTRVPLSGRWHFRRAWRPVLFGSHAEGRVKKGLTSAERTRGRVVRPGLLRRHANKRVARDLCVSTTCCRRRPHRRCALQGSRVPLAFFFFMFYYARAIICVPSA
jgi:hypothetical protein